MGSINPSIPEMDIGISMNPFENLDIKQKLSKKRISQYFHVYY